MKRLIAAIGLVLGLTGTAVADDIYQLDTRTNAQQQLAFTVGALVATAATFPAYTQAVRLYCSAACFVGTSATNAPSITAVSGMPLAADTAVTVLARANHYAVVIGVSGSGTLYVQALTK